ncbi:uncharacterized protein ATC70_009462 [Mucor velutinosus]|uniref:Uncharacterized protein n=1 Tax=Mucor velutinosus TaxID=708070 RepID=A0AAN7HV27_9FUNG|nr:hypothetical protein ATC70_009462 [Mucor velutinosus]
MTLQQDDNSDNSSCSFISGEGSTPYSTGDNDGSTCAVTNQPYGYDFYNYCLSSGFSSSSNYDGDEDGNDDGDDEDDCNTSTACYPYRQGDSAQQHVWRNLTCSSSCQLILNNGSPPPIPIPITNITTVTNTHHPTYGTTSSGNANPHRSPFDPRTRSPTSIALISVCSFVSCLLVIWLVRIVFYKTKYWPWINRYLCCGLCHPPVKPLPTASLTSTSSSSMNESAQPHSRPPSFQSTQHNPMQQHSIHSRNSSYTSLPSYHCQDPSLPKYEQAIVTQIRGMSFFDHHPSAATSASASSGQQPIWIPIYLSSSSVHNSTIVSSPVFNTFLSSNSDWARPPNTRHQPQMQSSSQTSLSIQELNDQEQEQEQEERRRPQIQ